MVRRFARARSLLTLTGLCISSPVLSQGSGNTTIGGFVDMYYAHSLAGNLTLGAKWDTIPIEPQLPQRERTMIRLRGLIFALLFASCWGSAQPVSPTIVGYYPDWNKGSYPYNSIPYQNLTHIAHAFLIPNSDGSLGGVGGFAYPELVQAAHQNGVKVIAALGGWGGSGGFPGMAADTASRRRFIENLKSFCVSNGYDGVDLDWEYPASAADRANLTVLVRELRTAFAGADPPLTISLALPGGDWSGRWFDVAGMSSDADWFGVMTYDFYGSWTSTSGPNSALFGSPSNTQGWIDNAISYYSVTRGIPASKILMGIPFYGWVFNSSAMYGASTGAVQRSHAAIVPNLGLGWTRFWDDAGKVPYMINPGGTQVISYDDSASIRIKCSYAISKGVQGAMIWALGQDYLNGNQQLLDAVGRGLGRVTGLAPAPSIPQNYTLEQCYPNPFNPSTTIAFGLPNSAEARLSVYDLLGREVTVLVNQMTDAGFHEVRFDGSKLTSGMYIYRLMGAGFVRSRRLVLLK